MLKELKFVQGAVAKKDFVPELTHFRIEKGVIKGFNGKLGLCSPIDLDLEVSPKAIPFIKAIQACKETVAMHITPAGRLAIKSGKFKAFIDCIQEGYPDIDPKGEMIELNGEFIAAIKRIAPYIADDASRPWARGILFRGESLFATNNIILVEYWLGYSFPVELNIPVNAIKELIRVGEEPTHLQLDDTTVTFHFEDGRWIKTNLLDTQWPDMSKVLAAEASPVEIPEKFYDEVEELIPFVDELGRIFQLTNILTTSEVEGEGASLESCLMMPERACFHGKQLASLRGVAQRVDFSLYPLPCIFYGENIRGAIVGIRA